MASVSLQLAPDQHEHRALYEAASQRYSQAMAENNPDLLKQALALALQARALKSDYLPSLNLLARIELQRHNYAAAELWVEQGLRLKPNSVSLLYSAGHIALSQHQLDEAEQYFNQTLKISRVATKALNSLAQVKFLQGDYVEAFRHYRELAKTQAHDNKVRTPLFEVASRLTADFYAEELEQDLLRYLDFDDIDPSQLRDLATSLLRHKLQLSEQGCPLELEVIANDPLLLACLAKFYFTDPLFERLFITLRQSLLLSCSHSLTIAPNLLPLIHALAEQCWLNEAVWYVTEQEQQLVTQLESLAHKLLLLHPNSDIEVLPTLALVLMYQPLAHCGLQHDLLQNPSAWPEYLQRQVTELRNLQQHGHCIVSLGASADATSQRVQQQYNEFPYPRWLSIGYNDPADYATVLQQNFPHAKKLLPPPEQKLSILVAGCGTGRHAIRLANYFPSLSITALDLSHTALAYATHMATHYAATTIKFIQGDLLNSAALGQQYDVIECSGVLHHMQAPEQGLQALSAQLKPGGLIKIALYSATARRSVSTLRARLAGNLPKDLANIRLMREVLLQQELAGDWQTLLRSADFYSTSACRDLIFHEQEQVFNVLDLPAFLASAGLTWVGMLPPHSNQELIQMAGLPAHQISVEHWHWLEQSHPDLFAGMYQFYAVKAK